jgi:hypothetical protein
MMDADAFRKTLDHDAPPPGTEGPLAALWHAAKGEWHKAHALIQHDESKEAARVHAHLHRIEGDQDNARYWYDRADEPIAEMPIDQEWSSIVGALLTLR